MKGDLRRAFQVNNLQLALDRLQRNQERYYKNHFRHVYRAYAISPDDSLAELGRRLRTDAYRCSHATKVYLPKASLVQRPMSLMSIEDQIVYQAMGNVVGDALFPIAHPRYFKSVFGNLYSGPQKPFCFRDWRLAHRRFTQRIIDLFNEGYVWTATFDLTACYDSIDHRVLLHFLRDLKLDEEFCQRLAAYLRVWTVSQPDSPIYQGHGIPQGPMTSGILSEVVLRFFDTSVSAESDGIKYLRYVDDIRLFAKTEDVLREQIVELDLCSKNIGLFPQSSKIRIHEIEDISKEVKTISVPDVPLIRKEGALDPAAAQKAIAKLSGGLKIDPSDESAFRYWLSALPANARNATRMLSLLEKYPHMFGSITEYLGKFRRLSLMVSHECLEVLGRQSMYGSLAAALIRVLNSGTHPDARAELVEICEGMSAFKAYERDPELREAVKSVLVNTDSLQWRQRRLLITQEADWWVRSRLVSEVSADRVARQGAFERLLNQSIKDESTDVALVAAESMGAGMLLLTAARAGIRSAPAQYVLRRQGLIGRIAHNRHPINEALLDVLGPGLEAVDWKRLLGNGYGVFMSKAMRWKSYAATDATAWVNYTDTLNDLLLAALQAVLPDLANYKQGHVGWFLQSAKPGRRQDAGFAAFAAACVDCHSFISDIHELRLHSDLSHPVDWKSGAPTRAITHKEIRRRFQPMKAAYLTAWRAVEPLL